MALVKRYEATDGSLFKTHDEYVRHETNARVLQQAATVEFDTSSFYNDDRGERVLSVDDVAEFVASNIEQIKTIIAASTLDKRGRKPIPAKRTRKPKSVIPSVGNLVDASSLGQVILQ